MNKKLHFTWGHIFAFIAIIFMVYASFMGVAFKTEGNFVKACIVALGVLLIFVLFFLVPQQLKATQTKLKVCIILERILLVLAVLGTLAFAILPQSPFVHFSSIVQKAPQIESKFQETIGSVGEIIPEYERYVQNREGNLARKLEQTQLSALQKKNREEILTWLLTPGKYMAYKEKSFYPYMEKVQNVKVWNVNVVSNLNDIKTSADTLVSRLTCQSSRVLSFEGNADPFEGEHLLDAVYDRAEELSQLFKDNHWSWLAFICAFMTSLFMIVPYFVQQRDGKNPYGLFTNNRFKRGHNPVKDKNDGGIDIVW